MSKDKLEPKKDIKKIEQSAKGEVSAPIVEALKFLANIDKFKPSDKELGIKLSRKENLTADELILVKQMLKGYKAVLSPDLYLKIVNVKPDKPKNGNPGSKAIEGLKGQFFCTSQGLKFYVEDDGIPLEIEGEAFEGLIADRKYHSGEGLPSGEEISNIKRLARYWASKNTRDIGVRVTNTENGFIYDPIRPDGKVYFISKSRIDLKTPEIPYTVRYNGMLEAPIENGTIDDHLSLIRLWHLDQKSEILSMGLDFSRFIPDIPHAIEDIDGPHGSGKTSYTEIKRTIFDPNGAPTQSLKFDERDISISAVHQGMLAFDNVNTAMPDYISDIICRLTTGQGFRTRELYTNMGEVILKLKRPIIINGINRASYKPDFIDRECPIHLGVMPDSRRLTDAEIREKAEGLIPKVRGYLISIMPKALELYSRVETELKGKLPRMADFVIWAECGIRAMGFPAMSFFEAYTQAKHDETVDVAKETLLINAIQGLMAMRTEWIGTTSDLLNDLDQMVTDGQRKSKAFPKDARRLGRLLKELEPTLREMKIEITENNSDKNERKKVIKKIVDVDPPKKLSEPEIPKVNVGDVGNDAEPTKSDVLKPTSDPDISFLENSSCRNNEPTKSDVQSKTDITDIKNEDSVGNEEKCMTIEGDKTTGKTVATGSSGKNVPMENGNTSNDVFSRDPKKAIFEVVRWESPKNKYGSLSVKALYDMIPDPSLSMKAIFDICEDLYNIGAFTKTSGGSYRINPEFKDGDL